MKIFPIETPISGEYISPRNLLVESHRKCAASGFGVFLFSDITGHFTP
ncbi:hypothetical protein KIS4809_5207 [Bacillus sp. ZZV12-4809]|nr:hypothetical protein KIS4809_5207 [Bacillus sp. ZZV12-4809]